MTKDELIEQLANLLRPGECQHCGKLGTIPNSDCYQHRPYKPGTDASTARHLATRMDGIVAQARQILGRPNSEFEI